MRAEDIPLARQYIYNINVQISNIINDYYSLISELSKSIRIDDKIFRKEELYIQIRQLEDIKNNLNRNL